MESNIEQFRDPGIFAVIPVSILERTDISSTCKILYAEILALSRKKGECFATNGYIAQRLGISEESVRRPLGQLVRKKLVVVEINRDKAGTWRTIKPVVILWEGGVGLPRGGDMVAQGGALNCPDKGEDNKEEKKREMHLSAEADFQRFWDAYPKKELKRKSREIWLKKNPPIEKVLAFIEGAKKSDRWKEGYIKQPTTFLNGECWEDDLASYSKRREVIEIKRY